MPVPNCSAELWDVTVFAAAEVGDLLMHGAAKVRYLLVYVPLGVDNRGLDVRNPGEDIVSAADWGGVSCICQVGQRGYF